MGRIVGVCLADGCRRCQKDGLELAQRFTYINPLLKDYVDQQRKVPYYPANIAHHFIVFIRAIHLKGVNSENKVISSSICN